VQDTFLCFQRALLLFRSSLESALSLCALSREEVVLLSPSFPRPHLLCIFPLKLSLLLSFTACINPFSESPSEGYPPRIEEPSFLPLVALHFQGQTTDRCSNTNKQDPQAFSAPHSSGIDKGKVFSCNFFTSFFSNPGY